MKSRSMPLVILAVLIGCGGGGGSSAGPPSSSSGANSGVSNGNPTPVGAKVQFTFVLARAVPTAVTHLRFTGLAGDGRTLYGPVIRAKATLVELENVPTGVVRFRIEYLAGNNVVGLATLDVSLADGVTARLENPNYTDVDTALTGLSISPLNPSVAKGRTRALQSTATFVDATNGDLTAAVAWATSDASIASINGSGQVLARKVGATNVTARYGNFTAVTNITVTAAELDAVQILPANSSLAAGTQGQFGANATYSDATLVNVTQLGQWTSSNTSVATVNSAGLVSTLATGQLQVGFSVPGASNTTGLTVTDARLASLRIEPPAALSAPDTVRQLRAVGTMTDASEVDLTEQVTWQSSNPGNATVSNLPGNRGQVSVVGQQLALGLAINATHPDLAQPAHCDLAVNRLVIVGHIGGGLAAFRSDLPNGQLTRLPDSVGPQLQSLVLETTGQFLYGLSSSLGIYRLNGLTGELSLLAGADATTGTEPRSLAFSPNQDFLYVANSASAGTLGISGFRRASSTGLLTAIGVVDPTRRINDVGVHPNGNFVFGLFSDPFAIDPGGVRVYARNSTTGQLNFLHSTATSNSALALALSADGRFVYIVDNQQARVTALSIDSQTGQLTPIQGSPFTNSDNPFSLALHPRGGYLYVGSALLIDVYSRDSVSGALVHLAAFPTGGHCSSISIDPTGRFLHATSEADFPDLPADVSTYRIDANTGLLSDLQQVKSGDQATDSVTSP